MPDFALPDELVELEAAARRLADQDLAVNVRQYEHDRRWPDGVVAVIDDFELGGLDVPAALGGAGAGSLAKVVVLEALAGGDPGGLPAVDRPGPAAGAVQACPDASVAAEMVTAARRRTGSAVLVVAAADDDRSIAALEVAWAPGWPPLTHAWISRGDQLSLVEIPAADVVDRVALGFHASGCAHASLEHAVARGEWTLPRGEGVNVRGRARLWTAAVAVGIGQGAFDATVAYTTERVVFGRPVAHHQGNAFDLAAAATDLHAARLSVRDAAMRFDAGDPFAGFWATQAWRTTMDAVVRTTDLGVQLLGGHGFLVDHLAEKRFREARMLALVHGGADAADDDVASQVLDVPDPLFAS